MIVQRVSVTRRGYSYYSSQPVKASEPFVATIEVAGDRGKIELKLSPDMSARIMEIIADEVAAAGRATAEAMTADVLTVKALPSAEAA